MVTPEVLLSGPVVRPAHVKAGLATMRIFFKPSARYLGMSQRNSVNLIALFIPTDAAEQWYPLFRPETVVPNAVLAVLTIFAATGDVPEAGVIGHIQKYR